MLIGEFFDSIAVDGCQSSEFRRKFSAADGRYGRAGWDIRIVTESRCGWGGRQFKFFRHEWRQHWRWIAIRRIGFTEKNIRRNRFRNWYPAQRLFAHFSSAMNSAGIDFFLNFRAGSTDYWPIGGHVWLARKRMDEIGRQFRYRRKYADSAGSPIQPGHLPSLQHWRKNKINFFLSKLFIIHYSLFIIHYSVFTIHYSLFISNSFFFFFSFSIFLNYSLFIIHIHYSYSLFISNSFFFIFFSFGMCLPSF